MNSISLFRVVLISILGSALLASPGHSQDAGSRGSDDVRILMVSGDGEIRVRPDEATVRVGVEVQSEDATKAQESVNGSMSKVIAAVQKAGVAETNIQTSGLSVSPVYAPHQPGRESEQPRVTGYRASNVLRVRITELDLVGKVIDAALDAGANRLEGVTFGLADELPHQTRALQLAAQEARVKARALAEALDVQLDGLHKINAGPVFIPYPTARFDMAETMAARAATPVQPGEIEVRASVTLEYRIRR